MEMHLTEDDAHVVNQIGARLLSALSEVPPGKQPPVIIVFAAYMASLLDAELREELVSEFEKTAEELALADPGSQVKSEVAG